VIAHDGTKQGRLSSARIWVGFAMAKADLSSPPRLRAFVSRRAGCYLNVYSTISSIFRIALRQRVSHDST